MSSPAKSNLPQDLHKCTFCSMTFKTLVQVLRHELMGHPFMQQMPPGPRFKALRKLIPSPETQSERNELKQLLAQAETSAQKLNAILEFYGGDLDKLGKCFDQLSQSIEQEMEGLVKVLPVGSFVTGLSLKNSDLDLFVQLNPKYSLDRQSLFEQVLSVLNRRTDITDIVQIRNARVSVIRCKHLVTNVCVDLNMSHPNDHHNSLFVRDLMVGDIRLKKLSLLLKIFMCPWNLTSYALTILIVFFLQQRQWLPSISELQPKSKCLPKMVPSIPPGIGIFQLLAGFFHLYGEMDFSQIVLCPYLGCSLKKESFSNWFLEFQRQLLSSENVEPLQTNCCACVQDPFDLQVNVAKNISSKHLVYMQRAFLLAAQACENPELLSQKEKLYDYLLFGLADQMVEEEKKKQLNIGT